MSDGLCVCEHTECCKERLGSEKCMVKSDKSTKVRENEEHDTAREEEVEGEFRIQTLDTRRGDRSSSMAIIAPGNAR